jgi:aspartyl-tRNA(Asn)/glutamyl-tRNA(Gln) amidotransferase subunit A
MTAPCDRRTFLVGGIAAAAGLALRPALAQSQDVAAMTLKEASEQLRRRAVSAVELTQACLKRIETYNPTLNAFITVTADQALTTAREMDAERQRGRWRGPLHGVPIALKDNLDTAGIRTTAASELFKDRVPPEDAEVVRRLKAAGAILVGKTNLHEFAYGGSSTVSHFGPVRNPWALERIPGGSSGGSAAATAANLCFGSLGTDTAGSVRMPASYCGLVGFKPTYGRTSNRGVIPLSWTLDHVGPLCRTVEDTALLLGVIAGFDALDPASVNTPVPDYSRALRTRTARLRLGRPGTAFFDNLDPEIETVVNGALGVLRNLTMSTEAVQVPTIATVGASPLHRAIFGPEALAYHSPWLAASPEKYQPPTRERLVAFSSPVTQQDYVQARHRCDTLRREILNVFATVDLLVTPTVAGPPSTIEPLAQHADLDPGRTRNLWPFAVYGLPAISVPCGFTAVGLPVGLQIVGAPFAEGTVLALAHAYEQATEWHKRHPTLNAKVSIGAPSD